MVKNLSAVIITKNEETNIGRCLESIKDLVSEIVIVDSNSTDKTIEICKSYGCNISQIEWKGFGLAKKFAVDSASSDWVFSIDADEEVTPELAREIEVVMGNPKYNIYKIKRNSFFLGKKIKHCGWDNDYPKRLFNRKFGNFNYAIVHETIIINGERGTIEAPLNHFSYPTIKLHMEKMNLYSELGAEEYFNEGRKTTLISALLNGLFKFIKMYFIKLGFLDGVHGFILSVNSAYGIFLKYIKLWDKTLR
ncbi:MAG: glycosyltransferase family 2 protein [Melioribacteraceae bacterium]|nr:glycosyltransferase family 2 protein [Melioribacteraceae bacterium]